MNGRLTEWRMTKGEGREILCMCPMGLLYTPIHLDNEIGSGLPNGHSVLLRLADHSPSPHTQRDTQRERQRQRQRQRERETETDFIF